MIVKPHEQTTVLKDPRQQAGAAAERQIAHYLHRSFTKDQEVYVLHDVRLEDHAQPEHDGSTGVCQIDHLLVHRWGLFIIESKSVTEEVRVRSDDSDGDEWSRVYRGKEIGMPSPIRAGKAASGFSTGVLATTPGRIARQAPCRTPHHRQARSRIRSARFQDGTDPASDCCVRQGEDQTAWWLEGTQRTISGICDQGRSGPRQDRPGA